MMKPISIIDKDYTQWIKELSSRYRRQRLNTLFCTTKRRLRKRKVRHLSDNPETEVLRQQYEHWGELFGKLEDEEIYARRGVIQKHETV